MKRILGFIKRPFVVIGAGSLFVLLVVAGLQHSGNLEVLELAAYDLFIRMEPKLAKEETRITIIEISEKDIQALGRWPLTDDTLAKAIGNLLKSKPRAIGVDIYRDIAVPPGTEALNRVFTDNPQVIGIMTVGERGVPPLSVIKGTEQEGFGDILIDRGGVVRRALLFLDDGENTFVSFALRLASRYLKAEGITLQPDPYNSQFIRLKDTTIRPLEESDGGYVKADARGYQFLLDYRNAGVPFRTYSFSDLLADRVSPEAIVNRIILVGVNAQSVNDSFFTPLSRGFDADQHSSGVVLHGHITNQLLRFSLDGTSPIATWPEKQKVLWLLSWSFLGGVIGFRTRSARRFSMLTAGGLMILFFVAYAAFLSGWWIPLVPPALSFFNSAVVVTAYLTGREKKERAVLMQIFSRHVSKEIAEMIWQQREQFLHNGRPRSQKMTATVLFSDLKGFTTMSEKMEPQDLIDWLNTYMESMAGLIMKHGGIVDNYVGDGIKADFGVPIPDMGDDDVRRHAMNAVSCALAMENEMRRLNALWSEMGHPVVGVRVGIHTGPVVGGLLGSSERLKYTTIGDTVNIASRLESFDKDVCKDELCRILIGDTTLRCLDARYATEKIGEVGLKGKGEKTTIHRVLGENIPSSSMPTKELCQ
jgi:adenylate cyclase